MTKLTKRERTIRMMKGSIKPSSKTPAHLKKALRAKLKKMGVKV